MTQDNQPPVEVIQGEDARFAAIRADLEFAKSFADTWCDGSQSAAVALVGKLAKHRLAFQSEARAGEGEMLCPQIEMGHGLVDVGQIHWQGRKGIVLHPRENFIPIGEEGDLKGDYWPVTSDVVIWIDSPGGADTIISELAPLATPSRPDREAIARAMYERFVEENGGFYSEETGSGFGTWEQLVDKGTWLSAAGFCLSLTPSPVGEGETWASIAEWCEATFGPCSPERVATRAREEMKELVDETEIAAGWTDKARIEAADVLICLSRVPGIWKAVEEKMAINRARKWRIMGDGTGYHERPGNGPPNP